MRLADDGDVLSEEWEESIWDGWMDMEMGVWAATCAKKGWVMKRGK